MWFTIEIAFELFQPFIMHHLINHGLAGNIKIARRLIQSVIGYSNNFEIF